MKHLFLDTSAYSAFRRGSAKVCEFIQQADRLFLNAVVIGELLAGFDRGRFHEANRRELNDFLQQAHVNIHPLTEETAERYAFIYNDLRRKGKPVPTNDLWIAATAMELGTGLITADSHFLQISQIQILFV